MLTPCNGPPVPQQPQATPEAGPSNKSATTEKPTGKKRKGDILVAGPKKTRIVSKEFIDSEDEETLLKLNSKLRPAVKTTAKPKSLQGLEILAKPKSKSEGWGSLLPQLTPTTQEWLEAHFSHPLPTDY